VCGKAVENNVDKENINTDRSKSEDKRRLIHSFFKRFPRFFDGKRYKLINFAPK